MCKLISFSYAVVLLLTLGNSVTACSVSTEYVSIFSVAFLHLFYPFRQTGFQFHSVYPYSVVNIILSYLLNLKSDHISSFLRHFEYPFVLFKNFTSALQFLSSLCVLHCHDRRNHCFIKRFLFLAFFNF